MAVRRGYHQFCGLAKALDVLGERWTLLIIRELLIGGRRYGDLLEGRSGITTTLLAERLQRLEADGLIEKVRLPPPASVTVYQLAAAGRALEPAVNALGAWGGRYMTKPARGDA